MHLDESLADQLNQDGFTQLKISLPQNMLQALALKDWNLVDSELFNITRPGEILFNHLSNFTTINAIEYIIAIRNSSDPDEEDGIWHDDGSRKLAYTLSLTDDPSSISGGILQFKKKGSKAIANIKTPPLGTLTIFKTGVEGYEHRVLQVTAGVRIISAGWIT